MADGDYVRLAAACHCGEPVRSWSGRGRRPIYCASHKDPPKPEKEERQCPACRGFFVPANCRQTFCARLCGVRQRRGNKPADEVRRYTCTHCGGGFDSTHKAPMYCSKPCKQLAWEKSRGIIRMPRSPRFSRYWAGFCADCGRAVGGRTPAKRCVACAIRLRCMTAAEAARYAAEMLHRAAAKEIACDDCGAVFCPLYGHGNSALCAVCAPQRKRRQRAVDKARRRARQRGAEAQRVDPFVVFDRDGWRCQLCRRRTPKGSRGSLSDDAPELDHIVPLSKGGAHTYANTQCACRRCNGLKGSRPLGQTLLFG